MAASAATSGAATTATATATEELHRRWADVAALHNAIVALEWDQRTFLPSKGRAARGRTLAGLTGLHHERLTDPALADAVEHAGQHAAPGSLLEDQVRAARQAVARAIAVPRSLVRRAAELESDALASWRAARDADDFPTFAPHLTETVNLMGHKADALAAAGIGEHRYDTLLDEFEPGATQAQLATLFTELSDQLAPLVAAVADCGVVVDESAAHGDFPDEAQEAFGRTIAEAIGYAFDAGRLDLADRAFSARLGTDDVRITWRSSRSDFRPSLFSILHEMGHALYEQGIDADLADTPADGAVSLGMHEGQARLWENLVGRSRGFWQWALPHWHQAYPDKVAVDLDTLWRALHPVRPSLIRIDADELTYNLHIVARFEIERALFAGDVEVPDLPGLWDDTYEELLGIRPTSATEGVLQDVHWALGKFGYFPTYAVGNLIGAQLMEAARAELGDLDAPFAEGDFGSLLGWLRARIHHHGSRRDSDELVEAATGAPMDTSAFLGHARSTVEQVYGITVP